MHIWHPQALDAFDDYVNLKVTFNNSEAKSSPVWTTAITIPHWILKPKGVPDDPLQSYYDERKVRKHGQIPPQFILDNRNASVSRKSSNWLVKALDPVGGTSQAGKTKLEKHELDLRVSSVVITGDSLGYYWIASVLSPSVKEEKMSAYVEEVQETMQLFVYWQSAGRRLAFIGLLGHVCSDIAREYGSIVLVIEMVLEEKVCP